MLVALEQQSNLNRYLSEIYKIPILTDEEEKRYAKLKDEGNINAAKILVSSHLRLVAKIAFRYQNYGLPMLDMIAEGNIGLIKAVKEFSLEKGCKLATYAMWWIKATIQDFILRSWSLVKVGTTSAQKKLFFNLNKLKTKILACGQKDLNNYDIKYISNALNVKENEVLEMNQRLYKTDISLNKKCRNSDDNDEIIELLPSKYSTPEKICIIKDNKNKKSSILKEGLKLLNDREKNILMERRLNDNPATLKDLSEKYHISGERIRQIEENAINKIKNYAITKYKYV